jgi:hypothetical protein
MQQSKVKVSRTLCASAEGERKYGSHSLTSTLGEVSGQRHALVPLYPGKGLLIPIGYEAEWVSELVWTQRLQKKSVASAGD